MTPEQKSALAALDISGNLTAALEALKERLIKDIMYTLPHETRKREDCYTKYQLIGDLKEEIKKAINSAEVNNG